VGNAFPLEKLDQLTKMESQSAYSQSEVRKNPLVVVFWASWCPYCRRQLPELNALYKTNIGHLNVVGVNQDDDFFTPANDAGALAFPQLYDTRGAFAEQIGAKGLPHIYVVGRGAKVLRIIRGYDPSNIQKIAETFRNEGH
jgi:thiol-disulfide isomerase/thioredoxin